MRKNEKQAFLDRLHHLLEARKQADKRYYQADGVGDKEKAVLFLNQYDNLTNKINNFCEAACVINVDLYKKAVELVNAY